MKAKVTCKIILVEEITVTTPWIIDWKEATKKAIEKMDKKYKWKTKQVEVINWKYPSIF